MKQFTSVHDVSNPEALVREALALKQQPRGSLHHIGQHHTIALLFFNPSLRTRLSTQRAAIELGMSVMDYNAGQGWQLEFEDSAVMNIDKAEHIKEAAAVISQYADIIGIRTFPGLQDRERDYSDYVLRQFQQYARVPVVSLESAIRHPLQSLADWVTIEEHRPAYRPKVVLSWAPHPRALPQAVANSFLEWMQRADVELVLTHPKGYELAEEFTQGVTVSYDQNEALEGANFIYAKNWSSYQDYGRILNQDAGWMITPEKMARANNGKFMHCLPVRRNVVVADAVLDSPNSLAIEQANNRTYAAMAVLKSILEGKD
ncbi:MAG: N-acetylornithine carbamoyltransferase [Lewinellaceae bacterium]|nr:N-acetylornithine carbamoyltransferase [Phaeodactylibacter sp.]MCB9346659.1 N-acetylornithine carbamoyltransferase [Lewinellaceae bacterium]